MILTLGLQDAFLPQRYKEEAGRWGRARGYGEGRERAGREVGADLLFCP